MKKILIAVAVCILFIGVAFSCRAQRVASEQKELRNQIVLYNLVNGLYLTEDQMWFILRKAKEVEKVRKEMIRQVEDNISEQTEVLEELKEQVKNEVPDISRDLAKKVHEGSEFGKKLRKEYIDTVKEAVKEVKAKLDETQLYNLQNFQPCLVPPRGPSRIGQDTSSGGAANLLERIRKMQSRPYSRNKDNIADRFIDRISLKNPHISEEELEEAREKVLEVMDEVRKLSDVDFELQKQDKVGELKSLIETEDKRDDVDQRIARFLLNPQIIPVLEEKIYGK